MYRNPEPDLNAAEDAADTIARRIRPYVYHAEADGATDQHGEAATRINVYFDLRGETERQLRYAMIDQLEAILRMFNGIP